MTLKWRYLGNVNWTHLFINISSNERSKALLLLNKDKSVIIPLDGILNFLNAVKGYEEMQKGRERESSSLRRSKCCESRQILLTASIQTARFKVRPHRTRSAAADCGLCPLRNVTF